MGCSILVNTQLSNSTQALEHATSSTDASHEMSCCRQSPVVVRVAAVIAALNLLHIFAQLVFI